MSEYKIMDMLEEDEHVKQTMIMPDDLKKKVLTTEMKRIEEMIPLINKGIEEAFNEDEQILVLTNLGKDVEVNTPTLTLQSESGKIIGEEVYDEEEKEELREMPNTYFISENFVTYTNLSKPGEKQFFVVDSVEKEFITDLPIETIVKSFVVAIPSTNTDHILQDFCGFTPEDQVGIMIIGFTE